MKTHLNTLLSLTVMILVFAACKEKAKDGSLPASAGVSVEGKKFTCAAHRAFPSDGGDSHSIAFSQGKFKRFESTLDETSMPPKVNEKIIEGTFTEDDKTVKAGTVLLYKGGKYLFPDQKELKTYTDDNQVIGKIDAALEHFNATQKETPGVPQEIVVCIPGR